MCEVVPLVVAKTPGGVVCLPEAMPQRGTLHVDAALQLIPRPHQVPPDIPDLAVALSIADLHLTALGGQLEGIDAGGGAIEFLLPVREAGLALQPFHGTGKLAARVRRRFGSEGLVAGDHLGGGRIHGGRGCPHGLQCVAEKGWWYRSVGRHRRVVLAGTGIPLQRSRLHPGALQGLE